MDKSQGGGELCKFKSNGIGGDKIGSDVTLSAQLRGGDGGEVIPSLIRTGLRVGPGCSEVCELASWVLGELVCMIILVVRGASGVVGHIFGAST
jgi:hypothetical protein